MTVSISAKTWLARYNNISERDVDNILKDEKATSYLLVWSIFEQDIFNGFMGGNDIRNVSVKFEKYYANLAINDIAQKFHHRYQNADNYKHLIHAQKNERFKTIIDKPFTNITQIELLEMLFYIVYRYRNNIFHGNKKVLAWTQYTEQIEDCLTFMTKIIDLNQKEAIIKKKQENNNAANS